VLDENQHFGDHIVELKKKFANQEMVGVGCLIPSMVSAGITYRLASPPQAADEPADLVMRNLGPFLYDCMS
jgi:hypothetical protein